jgi:hypothetical protein
LKEAITLRGDSAVLLSEGVQARLRGWTMV